MGRVFSMRWMEDGSVKLSKHAPKVLHGLAETGLLNQPPMASNPRPRRLPLGFKLADATTNTYGVEKGQVWASLDPRDLVDGQPRQVRVVLVGAEKVLVENLLTGKRSSIALQRFVRNTKSGYMRVIQAETQPAPQVEA